MTVKCANCGAPAHGLMTASFWGEGAMPTLFDFERAEAAA